MRWFIEEFKLALQQLRRSETWLFLGILTGFILLALVVLQFAFQTDSILRFLRLTAYRCQEMTNGPIIFMFCGGIFFLLAVSTTFGEVQRYYNLRHRTNGARMAREALHSGIAWGIFACAIAIAAIVFFRFNCN